MTLKSKNKELIGQVAGVNITFGDKLVIGEFEISGPGEYEVGGIMVASPEEGLYSIFDGGTHIVFWKAYNGGFQTDSKDLGQVDALVVALSKEKSTLKNVLQTINELAPSAVVPSSPELLEDLIKAESAPTVKTESYKVEASNDEKERQIVLLPCSQS